MNANAYTQTIPSISSPKTIPLQTPKGAIGDRTSTREEFAAKIQREFIEGSAIAADLFEEAIRVAPDVEVGDGGEVSTPIHDALNWKYTRFTHQARDNFFAALFINEDGSCWQAKLSDPLLDKEKGKFRKYESPTGNGSRAYLPPVNRRIRKLIADRYKVEMPPPGEKFWDWIEQHPEINITITEGGKKALCLLSLGYVAIALYGVTGGYRSKDRLGNPIIPHLIPDLARFAVAGRKIKLAFDQDEAEDTRKKVNKAINKFSNLLLATGAEVAIINWDSKQGKGVDDLIVRQGSEAFKRAYFEAMPFEHWKIQQKLENRLTYKSNLRLKTADLSSLEEISDLPQLGIIAIDAAKGTGKTKFTSNTIAYSKKALGASHRIVLSKNLCERLNLDYRGDLDKIGGQFINGSGYSLRVGTCIDSLLAIYPDKFAGCDLILDEVVQVVRHLLTSATCAQDGKRPALLARFQQLIKVARRVIIADADLDDATLDYICKLREEKEVFLIKNDYQPEGYLAKYFNCDNNSFITGQYLQDVERLKKGEMLFVTTDSKAYSKRLTKLTNQIYPEKRILLINSENSGGDEQIDFIRNPDAVINSGQYDIIICSPSVATGVSIETQGKIKRIYGVFHGSSSTDADIAQSLARVREPVERIIWCAKYGHNYCKVSQSLNPLEIKSDLKNRTDATASLVRSNLRPDWGSELENYDWRSDPHLNMYAKISANQNFSMKNLRDALLVRLRYEGNVISVIDKPTIKDIKDILKEVGQKIKLEDASQILNAEDLNPADFLLLKKKQENGEGLNTEERLALEKQYIKDFYHRDNLSTDDILWDLQGRRRAEIISLECQLFPELALSRVDTSLMGQIKWGQNICPWDISGCELKRKIREILGLNDFFTPDQEWIKEDLKPYADKIKQYSQEIKTHLNLTISDKMSDVQLVHQLLSQLGIKVQFRWSRSHPGHEGEKIRIYRLDAAHWEKMMAIINQRQHQRSQTVAPTDDHGGMVGGSSGSLNNINLVDDPNKDKGLGGAEGQNSSQVEEENQLELFETKRFTQPDGWRRYG